MVSKWVAPSADWSVASSMDDGRPSMGKARTTIRVRSRVILKVRIRALIGGLNTERVRVRALIGGLNTERVRVRAMIGLV